MTIRPTLLAGILIVLSFISPLTIGLLGLYASVRMMLTEDISGFLIFLPILSLGFISLCWMMWKSTKDKIIFGWTDSHNNLILFFPFRSQRLRVKFKEIKGYTKTLDDKSYGGISKNCLTLYFDNVKPIEFVQYQTSDLAGIEKELTKHKIKFLGGDIVRRDMWGNRTTFKYI